MQVRQKELAVLNFSLDVAEAYVHGLLCTRSTKKHIVFYQILCVFLKESVVKIVNQMMGGRWQTEMMGPFPCYQYVLL